MAQVERRPCLKVLNSLESNEVDLEMDAGPDLEPVQITNDFCVAGIFIGLGYRTNSLPGGLGYDVCERVLYSLQLFDVGIMSQ